MKKILSFVLSFACILTVSTVSICAKNNNDKQEEITDISISEPMSFSEMVSVYAVDTPTTKVVGFLFHRVPHDLVRLYHKAIGISLTHSPQA